MSKDFHVTVRVKNGRIIKRMRELGFTSVVSLARASGVSHVTLGQIILFRKRPYGNGDWLQVAYSVSAALRCEPEDLWPEHIASLKAKSSEISFEADISEVQNIDDFARREYLERANLRKLLSCLPERQRKIVSARFGLSGESERTLEDVAEEHGVSKDRVRQLEEKSLRKMRDVLRRAELKAAHKSVAGVLNG